MYHYGYLADYHVDSDVGLDAEIGAGIASDFADEIRRRGCGPSCRCIRLVDRFVLEVAVGVAYAHADHDASADLVPGDREGYPPSPPPTSSTPQTSTPPPPSPPSAYPPPLSWRPGTAP